MDGMSFGQRRPDDIKETDMFNMKTLLKAVSLAALTAAGLGAATGAASAAPWDHRYDRGWYRHERMDHRAFVNPWHVAERLRFHRYRMMGEPFFFHGRYVVRVHDRFGRPVLVQVDPYSGAFIRVL